MSEQNRPSEHIGCQGSTTMEETQTPQRTAGAVDPVQYRLGLLRLDLAPAERLLHF